MADTQNTTTTTGETKVLTLDGEVKGFSKGLRFSEVSEEIKKMLAPNRVMTEILVDNRPIDLVEEEDLGEKEFSTLGNVTIRTREVNDVYKDSLLTAPKICEALEHDAVEVKEMFESGELVKAQERVSEMTSLLEWLLQLISGFQAIGHYKLDEMKFSSGNVMDTVDRMQRLLVAMHMHFSAQKWDEFETILTGDFVKEVRVWKKLFEEVSKSWSPQTSKTGTSVQ